LPGAANKQNNTAVWNSDRAVQALFFLPVLKYGARRSIVPVNLTVSTHMTDYSDDLCFPPARVPRGLSLLPVRLLPLRG